MQTFNESEWIKVIFLLADTQAWINELSTNCFMQLPLEKKKLFRKDYYITPTALSHIIERHYYKINRYPHTGKFHIPIVQILHYLREAYFIESKPAPGSCNYYRSITASENIGFDKLGNHASVITIITTNCGKIITAFPGQL